MRHAVLGAGAIGGLIATALGDLGEDVLLVMRPEKLPGYPERLMLEQAGSTLTAAAHPVASIVEPADVLWVATKTYQLHDALKAVQATPAHVLPLLNGIDHIAILRSRFGVDRVLPATIAVGADRISEGRFVQRSPVFLNVTAAGRTLLSPLLARLHASAGFNGRFVENEETLLWSKLCFLAPFALVTSASGKDKGEIFADTKWKQQLYSANAEAATVATACGANIDAAEIQAILDSAPPTLRSSMAKDLVAGRQLELDAIAGPIVRGAGRYGLAVPVIAGLIAAVQAKNSSRQGAPVASPEGPSPIC